MPVLKIAVGSTNPVKLQAAERGFSALLESAFELVTVEVDSGVAAQPIGTEETLSGAVNRARAALNVISGATFGIGIEGGLERLGDDLLAMAWVVIVHADGRMGRARSGAFVLPSEITALIAQGLELGDADDRVFGKSDSKRKNGSIGLLTSDQITRADFYAPAVIMALIPFHNPSLTFGS
jgi:inosine/xanthosine triphosphatase